MKWACHLAIFLVSGVGWDKFLTILEETEWTSSGCIGPSGWPADTGTLVVAAGAGSGGRFGAEPKAAEIQFYQDKTSLRRPPFVPTAPSVNLRTAHHIHLCNLATTQCSHQTSPQTFWIGVQETKSPGVTLIFRQHQGLLTWPTSFCFPQRLW